MCVRMDYRKVKEIFEANGHILITETYDNTRQKLTYICNCGRESVKSLDKYQTRPFCKECVKSRVAKERQNANFNENVIPRYVEQGCTLISTVDDYKGVKSELLFICSCGIPESKKYDNFLRKPKCKKCLAKENNINIKFEDIKDFITSNDCEILINEDDYIDTKTAIDLRCKCGECFSTTFLYFKHENKRQCDKCGLSKRIGENHHNWNGGVSGENARARSTSEYHKWRDSVYKRDNYTCRKCGDSKGGNLEAHHVYNFSKHTDIRYEVWNGVTLCESCHSVGDSSFHSVYGTRNNTKEQLEEYLGRKLEIETHNIEIA